MKLLSTFVATIAAHGRLMEPPGRSSLHRFPNDPDIAAGWDRVVANVNDNQLFCGGLHVEIANGYKCGVCGDNYADARPRENELGGKYGSAGIIPRSYQAGSKMPLAVQITAHHKGWFEFRLCPQEPGQLESESCFDSDDSLMTFTDGTTRHYITNEFPQRPGKSGWWYEMEAIIPSDMNCEHCVLQWRYHCGNNWGVDEDGSGLGHGYQEEFYGCADVKVSGSGGPTAKPTTKPTTTKPTDTKTTQKPSTTKTTQKPSTTTKATTKTSNNGSFSCDSKTGLFPHEDCDKFYQCANGITYVKECPSGLYFNPNGFCDWPQNVNCKIK